MLKGPRPTLRVSRRTILAGGAALAAFAALNVLDPGLAFGRARPWLGVELKADKDKNNVFAKRVIRGSPADKAGVKSGDVILTVDGNAVATPRDVIVLIQSAGAGATVELGVEHAGSKNKISVVLADHPGEEAVLKLDKIGTFAPAWKGTTPVKGNLRELKQLKGKVALLDFWATWCGACREMVPTLNDLTDRFGPQGVEVVGLCDDTQEKTLKVADKLGMKYAVNATTSPDTVSEYGVFALPTIFLVDKKGVIRDISIGALGADVFDKPLKKLLAEP